MLTTFIAVALLFVAPVRAAEVKAGPDHLIAPQAPTHALTSVAVTLECTARADGQIDSCKVLGETHPGLGFAEAAIALMEESTVAPGAADIQFARTIQFTP